LDGAHIATECSACHVATGLPDGRASTAYRPLETSCEACHSGAVR
jgi:hypothetical protein